MVDTFYLHLEFTSKNAWSINLPFLCTKCGNCCKLEDFMSAGKINAKQEEFPEIHARVKELCEKLGRIWDADKAKYDEYLMRNKCPFLENKSCSIYEIRPEGCRLFPKTEFGMESQDCAPLTRFKKMRTTLKKNKTCKETYYFTGKNQGPNESTEPIKPAKLTEKKYKTCIPKLRRAGMTDEELALFNNFNEQNNSSVQR